MENLSTQVICNDQKILNIDAVVRISELTTGRIGI